jgi:hypothetical protein
MAADTPNLDVLQKLLNELSEADHSLMSLIMKAEGLKARGLEKSLLRAFMKEASRGQDDVVYTWRNAKGQPRAVKGHRLQQLAAIEAMDDTPESKSQAWRAMYSQGRQPPLSGFLHHAIAQDDVQAVTWAMKSGFNPNFYSPTRRSTPLGWAAFTGRFEMVKRMWAAGGDILMRLELHHLGPGEAHHPQLGTTLLHRVLRSKSLSDGDNLDGVVAVARFLAERYPEPLATDARGRTPLDEGAWSPAHDVVKQVVAERESALLRAAVPKTTSRRTKQRL